MPQQTIHALYEMMGMEALRALAWAIVFVVAYRFFIKGRK